VRQRRENPSGEQERGAGEARERRAERPPEGVDGASRARVRRHVVRRDDPPPGPEHAQQLADGAARVTGVVDDPLAVDERERVLGEGELRDIPLDAEPARVAGELAGGHGDGVGQLHRHQASGATVLEDEAAFVPGAGACVEHRVALVDPRKQPVALRDTPGEVGRAPGLRVPRPLEAEAVHCRRGLAGVAAGRFQIERAQPRFVPARQLRGHSWDAVHDGIARSCAIDHQRAGEGPARRVPGGHAKGERACARGITPVEALGPVHSGGLAHERAPS
jgi:hypothetical protein